MKQSISVYISRVLVSLQNHYELFDRDEIHDRQRDVMPLCDMREIGYGTRRKADKDEDIGYQRTITWPDTSHCM